MRALLQRVTYGAVTIAGFKKGEIGPGLVVLLGIKHDDTEKDLDYLVDKIVGLRIFTDVDGKFNDSLQEKDYGVLVVSQFTLYADTRKGRRPGFTDSARPELAIPLYVQFIERLQERGVVVQSGEFGADMQVTIHNDGPVTILLDSEEKIKRLS